MIFFAVRRKGISFVPFYSDSCIVHIHIHVRTQQKGRTLRRLNRNVSSCCWFLTIAHEGTRWQCDHMRCPSMWNSFVCCISYKCYKHHCHMCSTWMDIAYDHIVIVSPRLVATTNNNSCAMMIFFFAVRRKGISFVPFYSDSCIVHIHIHVRTQQKGRTLRRLNRNVSCCCWFLVLLFCN